MKLHSPTFEKTLRKNLRNTIRSSPELKRDFKRANKFRRLYAGTKLFRPALSILLALVVWHIAEATEHAQSALAVISLWTFCLIFFQTIRLWTCLFAASDLPALSILPVPGHLIYRWQLQKYFKGSFWSLLDFVAGLGALGIFYGISFAQWCCLFPIGVLAWSHLLALSSFCAARLPRQLVQILAGLIALTGGVLVFAEKMIGDQLVATLDQFGPQLNLFLPTGWAVSQFQLLLPEPGWMTLVLIVPVFAVIWTTRSSMNRLKANYEFTEITTPEAADIIPGDELGESTSKGAPQKVPVHLGLTEIESIVDSHRFLETPQWQLRGLWERLLWRWFNDREKRLAEFVFPDGVRISKSWKKIYRNLVVSVLLIVAAGFISKDAGPWVLAVGVLVTLAHSVGVLLNNGAAFRPMFNSGVTLPLYAAYPIGFRELARLVFKYSIVQLPLLLSFCMIWGALIAQMIFQQSFFYGIIFGAKLGCTFIGGRYVLMTFAFSANTNDNAGFRIRTFATFVILITCSLIYGILSVVSVFLPNVLYSFGLLALGFVDAYILFRSYGYFYNSNRFDLMRLPR
jgi:hypothetical protein